MNKGKPKKFKKKGAPRVEEFNNVSLRDMQAATSSAATSSTFNEDNLSGDGRRLKRRKLDAPSIPPNVAHPLSNSDNLQAFFGVESLPWIDDAPVEDEDEDEDDLDDGAQKARRYASVSNYTPLPFPLF